MDKLTRLGIILLVLAFFVGSILTLSFLGSITSTVTNLFLPPSFITGASLLFYNAVLGILVSLVLVSLTLISYGLYSLGTWIWKGDKK